MNFSYLRLQAHYYRPQHSCGKVYVFTGNCDSVQGGRGDAWWRRACMAAGMYGRGACMAGEGGMHGRGGGGEWQGGHDAWQERRPLQRTVCILLECILVIFYLQIFLMVNSLCKNIFLIFLANSLCFPCLE